MATKRVKKSVDKDELGCAAERGTACQGSLLISRLVPRSPDEWRDSEESELAEAGLVCLPVESLPDSFWGC